MIGTLVFSYLLPLLVAVIAGGASGGLIAWWLLSRQEQPTKPQPEAEQRPDPFVDAEIDLAAARWAEQRNQPAAAGLMANRLKLLHRIGTQKGWL